MEFSIIIATYDRIESLRRLLAGIYQHFGASRIQHEVIVANNARDDAVARAVDATADEFQQKGGAVLRVVREPLAGKCRAQNTAMREARGQIFAFFDDDVEVTPQWLEIAAEFFRREPFDVMQGPILVPPSFEHNAKFLEAQRRFRTINFVQYSPAIKEIKTLTGANMAARRELLAKVGGFNEELGPGRSGISEDVEFAQRVLRSGGRIGYEHRAAVYHEVDWSRLTEEFFRLRHEQQGRSRLIYKRQSLASIVPNLLRSVGTLGWYSLFGDVREQYRAKGRFFHYRAMLMQKMKSADGNQA
jgi:cellulose synthase/poly-beta-1,6-N-acetylglucosamine synthase-like glycosyltransferase